MVANPKPKRTRGVEFITQDELWQIIDEQARGCLGISGEEFARKWKNGEFEDPDRPELMHIAIMLPHFGK
ncbi:MAG: hypothetical protein ACYDCQ_08120 [Dehalococcoidia bacterium]